MLSFLVLNNLLLTSYLAARLTRLTGRRGWRLKHWRALTCPTCETNRALSDVDMVFRSARRHMRSAYGAERRFPPPDITV